MNYSPTSNKPPKANTIADWLNCSTHYLFNNGIGTARLDALVLLEDELHKNRAQLLAEPDLVLSATQSRHLQKKLKQRALHLPLSYIRGHVEFYGRDFIVSSDVLEPRPESETMIDLLKTLPIKQPYILADVGAGSGALGITAKLEIPSLTVEMLELSPKAINICKKNLQRYKFSNFIKKSNLLKSAKLKHDVILANLPYVPDHYHINEAAALEPRMAIFGGPDGLDLYRQMFAQLQEFDPARFVLTESLPFQHDDLAAIATRSGYHQIIEQDFIQVFEHKI